MQPSNSDLHSLCSNGNLEELSAFFEDTIHSLPRDEQAKYCLHGRPPCSLVPCTYKIELCATRAAEAEQTATFTYLWDTFLAPRGVTRIPWASLYAAARRGSIPLAEAFYARDPDCFKPFVDEDAAAAAVHGFPKGGTQINTGIRSDRFDYVDYMLDRGADINHKFSHRGRNGSSSSPLIPALRLEADDETTLRRVRFLVERGAQVKGTGALRAAASLGRLNVVEYLLSKGANVNDLEDDEPMEEQTVTRDNNLPLPSSSSSLIAAASVGHVHIVQFLLQHGADAEYVDSSGMSALRAAEDYHQDDVIEILKKHWARRTASD